jgi:hypothetical protein
MLREPRIPDHTASCMAGFLVEAAWRRCAGWLVENTVLRSFVKRFDYGTWFGNGNWGNRR